MVSIQAILPTVQVPTLVLNRKTDAVVPVALGSRMAAQIPGARYIEYPSGDHAFWTGDTESLLGDVEEFITGLRG
jgi:pimeloyl-ACP methyl ester carboxylesterase